MEKKELYEIYSEIKSWEKPELDKNRIREFEINYLPFIKNYLDARILDIGCGSGNFLDFLNKYKYKNYEGIDINEKLVALCKLKGHRVIQAEANDFLKSTKEAYDIIVLNDILEHLKKEDAMNLIENAKRKLNNNGIVIARVPNANYPFSNTIRYRDFTHELIYEIESLRYILKLYNLKIVYVGAFHTVSKNILRRFFRKIILKFHGLLMLILDGEIRPNDLNIFIIAKI
ncbi:MAG: class I SAM-dependent methyltransferase [Candidatus Methanoperedens sp.]